MHTCHVLRFLEILHLCEVERCGRTAECPRLAEFRLFGVWVWGLGLGLGFGVWGLGVRVWGLGSRVSNFWSVKGFGFRVQGLAA